MAARTATAADGALGGMRGEGPGAAARACRRRCVDLLAEVEARLDFEDDLPPLHLPTIKKNLQQVHAEVDEALRCAERGVVAQTGMQVRLKYRQTPGQTQTPLPFAIGASVS